MSAEDAGGDVPRKDWPAYYHAVEGREPRPLFVRALAHCDAGAGRQAIDLGCGDGVESLLLLQQGWRVLAIDQEPEAIAMVQQRTPDALRAALETQEAAFHTATLPPAHLIYAGASLPFCAPQHFADVWAEVLRALQPGGLLACHLFGDRDDWTRQQEMSFQTRAAALALCEGLQVAYFHETEEDGNSGAGPKHWHFYEIIALRPAA